MPTIRFQTNVPVGLRLRSIEGHVRGEDVRSISLSTFINLTKNNGGRNAA
jgi:hypothetical protein